MSENRNQEGRKSNRGFAAMDRERQREIARQGGRAAHQQGVAHRWTSEEAREAGRKGGERSRSGRRPAENNNNMNMNEGDAIL